MNYRWFALSIFLTHNLFVISNNLPDNPLIKGTVFENTAYIDAFFKQSWNFFSPRPITSDISIEVSCDNGKFHDLPQFLNDFYPGYNFLNPSRASYAINSYIEALLAYVEKNKEKLDLKTSEEYLDIIQICFRYCELKKSKAPIEIAFNILDKQPSPISIRARLNSMARIDKLRFPKINISNNFTIKKWE